MKQLTWNEYLDKVIELNNIPAACIAVADAIEFLNQIKK